MHTLNLQKSVRKPKLSNHIGKTKRVNSFGKDHIANQVCKAKFCKLERVN